MMQQFLTRFAPLIFVLGGILVAFIAILDLWHQHTYLPAKAEIVSIDVQPGVADDPDSYSVMVLYDIDGRTYSSDLHELKSGYYEGKEIDILYDPNAPENITTQGMIDNIIAIAVGILFMGCGVVALRKPSFWGA